jgi:hypothetical protein
MNKGFAEFADLVQVILLSSVYYTNVYLYRHATSTKFICVFAKLCKFVDTSWTIFPVLNQGESCAPYLTIIAIVLAQLFKACNIFAPIDLSGVGKHCAPTRPAIRRASLIHSLTGSSTLQSERLPTLKQHVDVVTHQTVRLRKKR